jgi:hypothetical protein
MNPKVKIYLHFFTAQYLWKYPKRFKRKKEVPFRTKTRSQMRGEEEPIMAMASSSLTVIFLWYREPSMGKDRAEEYMNYLEFPPGRRISLACHAKCKAVRITSLHNHGAFVMESDADAFITWF